MKKESRAEDFMKISGGILNALEGAKDYSREKIRFKIIKLLESLNFIKKEDFDVLNQMCLKLQKDNQALTRRIRLLEKKINNS